MLFSQYFHIQRVGDDDWFDPILEVDTLLFLDPELIRPESDGQFSVSHARLVDHFDAVFREAASTLPGTPADRVLVDSVRFPEVSEVCLGYTYGGTSGRGTGAHYAQLTIDAIRESISAGLIEIHRFEEIALLKKGIGADFISDMTANILRDEFCRYTALVCERHSIQTEQVSYQRGRFNPRTLRWERVTASLPVIQVQDEMKHVILVPERFLGRLPAIYYEGFADYLWSNENQLLRDQFNITVKRNLNRDAIVEIARQHQESLKAFVTRVTRRRARPYNLRRDPGKLHRWYSDARSYAVQNPITAPVGRTVDELCTAVDEVIQHFRHFVEQGGGWNLLWNDNGSRKGENAVQLVFWAIAATYGELLGIDVTPEAGTGRGPVDFKFSDNTAARLHVEVKLASNSHLADGILEQVPTYLNAGRADAARVVVAAHDADQLESARARVPQLCQQASNECEKNIAGVVIDARRPPSASQLRRRRA